MKTNGNELIMLSKLAKFVAKQGKNKFWYRSPTKSCNLYVWYIILCILSLRFIRQKSSSHLFKFINIDLTYLTYRRIPLRNLALSVTSLRQSSLSDALRSVVARGRPVSSRIWVHHFVGGRPRGLRFGKSRWYARAP